MSHQKLNILFFPAWFPHTHGPLGGRFVVEHAKMLKDNAEITVMHILQEPKLNGFFKKEKLFIHGLNTIRISSKKIIHPLLKPLNAVIYLISAIFLFFGERKRYRHADLCHVHVLTRTALLPYFIKLIYGIPYVISEHWSRYLPIRNTYHGFLRKMATKFFVKKSNGVATVSKNLKEAMMGHGLDHHVFEVVSNVIDENRFYPNPSLKEENREFVFLHVSGLNDKVKNICGMLNVVKKIEQQGYRFKFVIVGDDEEEGGILRNYALEIGVSSAVFTGKLYGEELLGQFQRANAFVLFSNFENQPCVVIEAILCGLPVIATNVGGLNEMLCKDNGILIEPKNECQLEQALLQMLSVEIEYNADHIRRAAINKHGMANVTKQLMSFYAKALVFGVSDSPSRAES